VQFELLWALEREKGNRPTGQDGTGRSQKGYIFTYLESWREAPTEAIYIIM